MATLTSNWRASTTEGHGHRRRPAHSESSTLRPAVAAVLLVLSTMAGIALFVEVKVVPGHASDEIGFDTRMRPLMREELRGEGSQALLVEAGDSLASTVRQFYRERQYAPAWIGASGPSQGARDLAALLSDADNGGTAPELCGASRIRGLIEMVEDGGDPGTAPVAYSELDVRLTVGLLLYAREKAGPDRLITSAAWLNVLEAAVARDDPRRVLEQLEHRRELYAYLLAAR
jgi:hypothetical protein